MHNVWFVKFFLDNFKDEFSISSNLTIIITNGAYELCHTEKKGLNILFEIQKPQDIEYCYENIKLFVQYLLQNNAPFLALFIMKNYRIFDVEASKIAISNAISINSKVTLKNYCNYLLFRYIISSGKKCTIPCPHYTETA